MNTKRLYKLNLRQALVASTFIFSIIASAGRKGTTKPTTTRRPIVIGGVEINAYPADNSILDEFKLWQTNLYKLNCRVERLYNRFNITGTDSYGSTTLSIHHVANQDFSVRFVRSDRDAAVAANTVLRRYISAGICSSSSKYYNANNGYQCEEIPKAPSCPPSNRSRPEYW